MNQFWKLFKESVIMQSIISIGLIAACIVLWLTGKTVPQDLSSMTLLAVGFFFGSKYQNTLNKTKED